MKKVGLIGAGLGGISAAIYLSKSKNYEIHIFEKNDYAGGKLGEIISDGYRFDTGPSVVTMIDVIKDLFTTLGENPDNHIEFEKLDPVNRNFFSDRTVVDSLSDFEKFKTEIAKIDITSVKNLEVYFDRIKGIYDRTAHIFLFSQLHEIIHLIKTRNIPNFLDFLKIDSMKTMHEVNSKFFRNPKILQIFDRYATYNGSSPYLAPGTLNLISYVELILGAYYIKGGISQLSKKLYQLAVKAGVKFHFKSYIDEIIIQNKTAKSIKVNNQIIDFDYIISNSDVVHTFKNLIKGFDTVKNKVSKLEPSISGMVFLWGIKGEFEQLKHHNVFYSDDYKNEFKEIFDYKNAPDDPTIYIAITSKSDTEHSPAGSENWFVLLNMPYNDGQDWEEESHRMKKIIIQKLKNHNIDIENKIEYEKIITPADLENRYLSNKGSIYGISSNNMFTAFKRQANRSGIIKNLYFAGGSAHPGGGIPLVILSGKHCAEIIHRN
jgi:phytoene desaturase